MALRAEKHFRDYDVETRHKNGRTVRELVYRGDLYRRCLDDEARRRERIAYLVGSVCAALLVLAAVSRPATANVDGFFAACSLLALIPAFCVVEGSMEGYFRRGDLKTENYRERLIMLRVMPMVGAVLGLVLAVGYLLGLVGGDEAAANGLALASSLAAAAVYAAIAVHEMRVSYQVIPGERSGGQGPEAANQGEER